MPKATGMGGHYVQTLYYSTGHRAVCGGHLTKRSSAQGGIPLGFGTVVEDNKPSELHVTPTKCMCVILEYSTSILLYRWS